LRILLWHGYLLGGTGSNVYTRSIAREWSRAGHEVVRPDIGGLLPVFVLDRYEGFEVKLLQDLSPRRPEGRSHSSPGTLASQRSPRRWART
jgi:hypothetical protein